ncbi:MAG: hypothetical protein M1834_000388 [Cirrosporium novae-zelandiae]|nr:MAG: hypothetical protein M1834_000388 [Cirrosporium novae-zelandiae]
MPTIPIGTYLFDRIRSLGIKTIFGVPGDYELALLDLIPKSDLQWLGSPSELVAAYSADGYSRTSSLPGALITTFGPGELSAVCGVAGSYCEFVPIVHIVGYPSLEQQKGTGILHHTLGDLDYEHFHQMSKQISCATTVLTDPNTATSEIDRVLNAMLYYSKPVYIGIPRDIAMHQIPSLNLDAKPLVTTLPPNNATLEEKLVYQIRENLESYDNAVMVVDGGAVRHGVIQEAQELMSILDIPVFTCPMSKGSVNEHHPRFGGIYAGIASKPDVRETVEASDCILWIGNFPSDLNTGAFTESFKPEAVIGLERFWCKIGEEKFDVRMKWVLQHLIKSIKLSPLKRQALKSMPCTPYPAYSQPAYLSPSSPITHKYLWPRFAHFLRSSDIVIPETGTSQAGMNTTHLPEGCAMFTQLVFGSIGMATGAAVGATIAAKERGNCKRIVLVTGEGSLQMTVQSLSILIRQGTNPIIFVLNNAGYTIERLIHGPRAPYNDLPNWKYTSLLEALGPDIKSQSYEAHTVGELDLIMNSSELKFPKQPTLIEMFLDKLDGPEALKEIGQRVGELDTQS